MTGCHYEQAILTVMVSDYVPGDDHEAHGEGFVVYLVQALRQLI